MATFGQWLATQSGRQDDIGLVAQAWEQAKDRPRLSGVKSISEWVAQRVPEHVLPPERVNQALLRAGYEYREVNAGRQPLAAVPDTTLPQADQPVAPSGPPAAEYVLDQAGSPAVMAALGRIERMIAGLAQELAPLVELARDVGAQASPGDAEAWAGQPPAETYEGWVAEGQEAPGAGLAEQALLADAEPGPAMSVPPSPQVAGLYGDTPSQPPAEPNWAALAEQADPGQAG